MIDGIELCEGYRVVALEVTLDGNTVPLGLWEGSIENATNVTALMADPQARGLRFDEPILCVINGAKALANAIRTAIGEHTPTQRSAVHHADTLVMPTPVVNPLMVGGSGRCRHALRRPMRPPRIIRNRNRSWSSHDSSTHRWRRCQPSSAVKGSSCATPKDEPHWGRTIAFYPGL